MASNPPGTRPTSRQRREQREMKRREKLMIKSMRNPGLRDRIVGCGFASLIVGGALFVVALLVTAGIHWWQNR